MTAVDRMNISMNKGKKSWDYVVVGFIIKSSIILDIKSISLLSRNYIIAFLTSIYACFITLLFAGIIYRGLLCFALSFHLVGNRMFCPI